MKAKYFLIVAGIAMVALLATCSLKPHDTRGQIARGKAMITRLEEKFHRHRLKVTDIEYLPHRALPEIEDWPNDCYKVTLSIPGEDVVLTDYLDCNVTHDEELLAGELTGFQNYCTLTTHPITLREIVLLKEYARLSNKPVDSFRYEGNSLGNCIGVWSIYTSEQDELYYFKYDGRNYKFLRSDHGY